jgi:hypothetical protein
VVSGLCLLRDFTQTSESYARFCDNWFRIFVNSVMNFGIDGV